MNAPRYVEKNQLQNKEKQKDYDRHVRKINDIVSQSKKPENDILKLKESVFNAKAQTMQFMEAQKQYETNRQN